MFAALLLSSFLLAPQEVGRFDVRFDAALFPEGFTGDLFVAFSERGEPRQAMHGWFGAPPVMRFTVEGVAAGGALALDHAEAAAQVPLDWAGFDFSGAAEAAARADRGSDADGEAAPAEPKTWRVQAIARRSRTGREAGLDAGDVHSAVAELVYRPGADGVATLTLDTLVEERPFRETERVKLFEFESPALTAFHGFPYVMRAGVLLPRDWRAGETYPVVYSVTGFGGTANEIHAFAPGRRERAPTVLDRCIVVVPDASNRWGHSVFCDSASIGPWGQALVHELIPALEARFGGAGAEHRYVTGVSSGGWSSLWLQVAYPTQFAGCFSHVPDPIDFHDFQRIDLYTPLEGGAPRNMYVDESGAPRPLARRGDTVLLSYEDFVRREHVLNPGGQIRSFEATFSAPGPDGTPRRIFDVATGAIDHDAARSWRRYDISHQLLTRWEELRGDLAGKIHVYAGAVDTFYLEGAVVRFRRLAEEAGILSDMTVEVVPGMAHQLHGPGHELMLATIERRWNEAHPPAPAEETAGTPPAGGR
jgi:hypothetical protein